MDVLVAVFADHEGLAFTHRHQVNPCRSIWGVMACRGQPVCGRGACRLTCPWQSSHRPAKSRWISSLRRVVAVTGFSASPSSRKRGPAGRVSHRDSGAHCRSVRDAVQIDANPLTGDVHDPPGDSDALTVTADSRGLVAGARADRVAFRAPCRHYGKAMRIAALTARIVGADKAPSATVSSSR